MIPLPIYTPANERAFIDFAVYPIVDKLNLLTFTDANLAVKSFFDGYVYPLCQIDENGRYAKYYAGKDADYIKISALDDKLKALAFFYSNRESERIDTNLYRHYLSLIVWFCEKRFDNVQYELKQRVISFIVQNVFNNMVTYPSLQIHTLEQDVFTDLDTTAFRPQNLPFGAVRFEFQAVVFDACKSSFLAANQINVC